MKHFDLIQRAVRIVWKYKVLWLFGILLALTGGGAGSAFQFRGGGNGRGMAPFGGVPPMHHGAFPGFPQFAAIAGTILLLCCCLIVILVVVGLIVRYVAQAAMYRIVDKIEETGDAPTWQEGFGLGWSNRTFRLWLMNFLVGIIFFVGALILALPVLSPLLLMFSNNGGVKTFGGILAVIFGILSLLLLLVVGTVVNGLRQFWGREIVLADRGIGESFASGFELVRRNFKDVALMWLLLLGIGLAFGLLMIPVGFFVLLIAGVIGGGIGWLMYQITNSVGWAIAFGAPPFLALMIIPLTFIGGLYAAFDSAAWTLTYREVADRNDAALEEAISDWEGEGGAVGGEAI
jgi:hypothetical protein